MKCGGLSDEGDISNYNPLKHLSAVMKCLLRGCYLWLLNRMLLHQPAKPTIIIFHAYLILLLLVRKKKKKRLQKNKAVFKNGFINTKNKKKNKGRGYLFLLLFLKKYIMH